jgi:type I restriction enzyme, R subunit
MTDLFGFLKGEWPEVYEAAAHAAEAANHDPRTACFYVRRTLELAVNWAFEFDRSLRLPYQDNLSALTHEPTFKAATGPVFHRRACATSKRRRWGASQYGSSLEEGWGDC